jgi:hypothetical protein
LINCVFPGVPDVLARDFLPVNILIKEDFPTLLLPANANSENADAFRLSKVAKLPS